MPRWTTETRRDREVFSDLAGWWDSRPTPRSNPFLSSAVLGCWEDGFDEPESRLNVVLLHRDGDLVAALPLYRARGRLRSMSRAHSEPFDVVGADDEEVTDHLPAWLNSMPMTHLYRVAESSAIISALPAQPRWLVQTTFNSPYVDLSSGMDRVRAGMSKDFQRTLRRRRRRLEEMGPLEVVETGSAGPPHHLLDAGLALEAVGWKGQRGHAVLNEPTHERWYRSVTEVAQDRGWLRLCGLFLDGRLLAFRYDLEVGATRWGMLSAFDESPDVASLSPGTLLLERVLETCAANGLDRYEFGSGNDQWKYEWAPELRQVHDLLLFGSGPTGRALHAWKTKSTRGLLRA
ncbi:MAG TPA: GNAT family N-acetyltransferase [Acidimicrobiia bacterium]|nr:GNAT family N-acetyltransferase [Acidimicrobiia bacterium]